MYRRTNGSRFGRPRFDDYREITAKYDGTACNDAHAVHKGDRIGYAPRFRKVVCAACWRRWQAENAEADAIEAGYMPSPW